MDGQRGGWVKEREDRWLDGLEVVDLCLDGWGRCLDAWMDGWLDE